MWNLGHRNVELRTPGIKYGQHYSLESCINSLTSPSFSSIGDCHIELDE
jgi:hypothetical protein